MSVKAWKKGLLSQKRKKKTHKPKEIAGVCKCGNRRDFSLSVKKGTLKRKCLHCDKVKHF